MFRQFCSCLPAYRPKLYSNTAQNQCQEAALLRAVDTVQHNEQYGNVLLAIALVRGRPATNCLRRLF